MTHQIKFSHNWNNKLNCNLFTTIRRWTYEKERYYKDLTDLCNFDVVLNGKKISKARLKKVSVERLIQIRPTIARLDTGEFEEEKIFKIFKGFGVQPEDKCLLLTFVKSTDKTSSEVGRKMDNTELREKIIEWANKWGYKGVDPECIKELKDILKGTLIKSSTHSGGKQ